MLFPPGTCQHLFLARRMWQASRTTVARMRSAQHREMKSRHGRATPIPGSLEEIPPEAP